MEVDGRWFFFHCFSFSNWGIFRFHVIHVVRFRVYVRSFQTWKRRALLIIPGNSYGDLIRPSLAGPVIRCWISPLTPNLGICWVNESPLWCRTWLNNFYRKKLLAVTMFQPMISVHTFLILKLVELLHDLGLIPDSRVYIFFVRLDKRYPSLSTTGSGFYHTLPF